MHGEETSRFMLSTYSLADNYNFLILLRAKLFWQILGQYHYSALSAMLPDS